MTGSVGHVLIVGGGKTLPELIRAQAPNAGVSVICRRESLAEYPDLTVLERIVSLSADTADEDWVAAARFLDGLEPVDALVTISEDDMAHAANIGAALGLPAPAPGTVEAVNRKDLMRRILAEAGVDPTPNRVVSGAQEIEAFAAHAGYPLICKPVSGSASQGISRIDGPEDVPRAWKWTQDGASHLACGEVLVEPFHEGTEYSVECISEDGSHLVAGVTAKYLDDAGFVELGHVVPAPLPEAEAERIGATVTAALSALGVTDGVTHTEVMVKPDAVRIIETHLRPAGDGITRLLALARGIDLDELLVRQRLGEKILDPARRAVESAREIPFHAAIWHARPQRPGVLEAVEGLDEARGLEGVWDVKVTTPIGKRLDGELYGSDSRPAYAWAVGDTPEQALARARAAIAALVFVTAP